MLGSASSAGVVGVDHVEGSGSGRFLNAVDLRRNETPNLGADRDDVSECLLPVKASALPLNHV